MIELSEQQRQAVKNGQAVRIALPEIGEDIVVLRLAAYEDLQDKRQQDAVLRYSMKQAAEAARENPY